jgi:hypothetical protein
VRERERESEWVSAMREGVRRDLNTGLLFISRSTNNMHDYSRKGLYVNERSRIRVKRAEDDDSIM